MTHSVRIAAAAMVALSTHVACTSAPADEPQLRDVRRGRVEIRVAAERTHIRLAFEPTHGPADYAYLMGPDGRTLARKRLGKGESEVIDVTLDRGPGTYTVLPSPSHRMSVTARDAAIVFETETEFPSLYSNDAGRFAFDVPPETASFTVAATSQHGWETTEGFVRVLDPSGKEAHRFQFENLDQDGILARLGVSPEAVSHYRSQGDTAEVPEFRLLIDRWTATDPSPGRWHVEANITTRTPNDIGFWLEGIPNRFAPHGAAPFPADPRSATARIRLDSTFERGPAGDVGAVWGWTVFRDESLALYEELGLSASKHFYPQVDMEATNDDDDPNATRMDGFLFAPFMNRLDIVRTQRIPMRALMTISRIAPWALKSPDEIGEFAAACVRFHQVSAGIDPDNLYWQFLNEPNHEVTRFEYLPAFRAASRRAHAVAEEAGQSLQFGGPGTGNTDSDAEALPWEWIRLLIEEADEELDFVVWNQYRLGRIADAWRYREHVDYVDSLITSLDRDGRHEGIIIGATNLRGGIVLENDKQDGPYSAVWWPAVLCHTLGTGKCRMINYFFLVDQGARRKGLVREDWSRKPVAHATAFFNAYRRARVVDARSDHDGVACVAMRDPESGEVTLVAVNTTRNEVRVTLDIRMLEPEAIRRFDAATGRVSPITPDAGAVSLPAWTMLGATFRETSRPE